MKNFFLIIIIIANPSIISKDNIIRLPWGEFEEILSVICEFLPDNPTIVEAGAYDGSETVMMAKKIPDAKIYSFEPVPELYRKLNTKANSYKNINTYQLALADFNGKTKFHTSEESDAPGVVSQSSSILKPKDHLIYSSTCFKNTIEVSAVTLDTWAKSNNIDHIDFLWLDMQGYELNTLKASPEILKTVKVIFTEVEFVEAYAGQSLYQEIKSWLESQGFKMVARNFDEPIVKINAGNWFGDALFIRK